ncbi:hypothetical protein [Sphingobacterium siyangense]|jgi:hypothetical protein|uniref:hypothetical protein n=1 Tax=Sphingobacterium siyangense TaxID=459529 RepID=UPI0028B1DE20|nr:hypothetical protein [Sphingobacterium siyangense]
MKKITVLSSLFITVTFVLAIISYEDKVDYADVPDFSSESFTIDRVGLDSTFISENNVA